MKKFLLPFIAAAILFALSACRSGTDAAGGETTLSFLRLGNDEAERVFWAQVIASYQEEHPGVKVEYDEAAIGDDMDTKLTSLFVANDGPDIVGHGIMSVASRAENGHYVAITDYYDSWEGKNDLFPQLVELGT